MDDLLLPDGSYWEPDFEPSRPLASPPAGELQSFDYELELQLESWGGGHTPAESLGRFEFNYGLNATFPSYDHDSDMWLDTPSPSLRRKPDAMFDYFHEFELQGELHGQPSEHVVLFYDDESERLREAANYISAGLSAGEHAIIVVTPEHRAELLAALPQGLSDRAQAEGRFVIFDARETLALFMRDGLPDYVRFQDKVGSVVRDHVQRSPRLRTYGQMPTLLWLEGNVTASMQLENLWNELQEEVSFSLLCAYPLADVPSASEGFAEICSGHMAAHLI